MKTELVFATNNPNKLRELQAILGDSYHVLSLEGIGCHVDIPENEPTLEGNARAKSEYVFSRYGYDCFADDTGLEIDALQGEPGVFSARYAGESKSSAANMEKVLRKMQGLSKRTARFRTIISLFLEGKEYQFEGKVEGVILEHKQGDSGFGYDPVFQPIGYKESFAEMPADEKNKISHRGIAVRKLIDFLKKKTEKKPVVYQKN